VSFDISVQADQTPAVYVAVAEIRELLLNLLFNAIDAMPNGGRIVIAARQVDGDAEVAVTDEGIGMAPDVLDRVFEPFFSTKGDQGYGLGLAVCRSIVERHGGKLSARSTVGKGSTFTLRLPAAPAELLTGIAPSTTRTGDGTHRRVLLVDDQHEVRESVGEMLRALGHEVLVSEEGNAALAMAMRQPVDLVMTDLGMPNMNGLEVARRLRTAVPGTPVVLLTGWGVDDNQVPENVTCVLNKPITMKLLADALAASTDRTAESRRMRCS
jgi:CheY-like chemotaxis protein